MRYSIIFFLLSDDIRIQGRFQTLIAEVDGEAEGFALFFHNYSTWQGLGIYLEACLECVRLRGGLVCARAFECVCVCVCVCTSQSS